MSAMIESSVAKVPFFQRVGRYLAERALTPVLRQTVVDTGVSEEAIEQAEQGKGLIIVADPHTRKDDGFQIAKVIVNNPILRDRKVLYPVAKHQESSVLRGIEKYAGIQYPLIVTADTLEDARYKDEKLGNGSNEYIERMHDVLVNGGTVVIFLQGKREPWENPENRLRPIGTAITALRRLDRDNQKANDPTLPEANDPTLPVLGNNYGIMQLTLGEPGRLHYDSGGLHPFTKTTVTLSSYHTFEDFLNLPEVEGKVSKIDDYLRKVFHELHPQAYRYEPTKEIRELQAWRDREHKKNLLLAASGAITMGAGVAYTIQRLSRNK